MLPEGWESKKLGNISSLVTSGSRDWAQFYSDTGSKFIRMTNLRRDSIYLKMDDLKFVDVNSDSTDGKRTSLQAGDILISITAELGKIGWIHSGLGEAFINQHTALVRVKLKEAESKFIAYLLCSGTYHRRINSLNDAGAKAGLNLATIRTLDITLPPLPEQKKIAQILSTWDNAISATERLLENSQQRKKALMQQLLTGKKRLPGFEGEWEEVMIGELLRESRLPTVNNDPSKRLTVKLNLKGIEPRDVRGTEAVDATTYFARKAGQFIYGKQNIHKGSFGIIPDHLDGYETSQDLPAFDFTGKCDSVFFFYYICQEQFYPSLENLMSGTGSKRLNPKSLFKVRVRVPNLDTQKKIASILTTADQEIDALQKRLDHLKLEKKALMQQLLTGKRRVQVEETA